MEKRMSLRIDRGISVKKLIVAFCLVFIIGFIFINSMKPSNSSQAESDGILNFINRILFNLGMNGVTSNFIRKLAHFTEFFALGVAAFFVQRNWILPKKNRPLLTIAFGAFIAICDEVLQFGSFGRSPQIKDVLIDTSGVIVAVWFLIIMFKIMDMVKGKRINEIE